MAKPSIEDILFADLRRPNTGPKGEALSQKDAIARLIGTMAAGGRKLKCGERPGGYCLEVHDAHGLMAIFFVGDKAAYMDTHLYHTCCVLTTLCVQYGMNLPIANVKEHAERHFPRSRLRWPKRPLKSRLEAIRYVVALVLETKLRKVPVTWTPGSEDEIVTWLEERLASSK